MPTYTEKYYLKKPDQEDMFDIDDINGNMDKVDTALTQITTQMESLWTEEDRKKLDNMDTIYFPSLSHEVLDVVANKIVATPTQKDSFTLLGYFQAEYDGVIVADASWSTTGEKRVLLYVPFAITDYDNSRLILPLNNSGITLGRMATTDLHRTFFLDLLNNEIPKGTVANIASNYGTSITQPYHFLSGYKKMINVKKGDILFFGFGQIAQESGAATITDTCNYIKIYYEKKVI